MKQIILIVFIMTWITQLNAQNKAIFTYYGNDSVSLSILDNKDSVLVKSKDGFIDCKEMLIDSVGIVEKPNLDSNAIDHSFKVFGTGLVKNIKLKNPAHTEWTESIKQITFQSLDEIIAYRKNDSVGFPIFVLPSKEIAEKEVIIQRLESTKSDSIVLGREEKVFNMRITNNLPFPIHDLKIQSDGAKSIHCFQDTINSKSVSDTLSFKLTSSSIDIDTTKIDISYKIMGAEYFGEITKTLIPFVTREQIKWYESLWLKINKLSTEKPSTANILCIVGVLVLLIILVIILFKRKNSPKVNGQKDSECSTTLPDEEDSNKERDTEHTKDPEENGLQNKLEKAEGKINILEGQIDSFNSEKEEEVRRACEDEKKKVIQKYNRIIIENYVSIQKHENVIKKYNEKIYKSQEAIENFKGELISSRKDFEKTKEELKNAGEKIGKLDSEKAKLAVQHEELKNNATRKNMHFLFVVEETLLAISNNFSSVYKDLVDENIRRGLFDPMLKGVSGLSTGILSWYEDYKNQVKEKKDEFFGGDLLTMDTEKVKENLSEKFILNIIRSDSFSKFVRLYKLSKVPWIYEQLFNAGINLDLYEELYYGVHSMMTYFGFTIICPKFYEEKQDSSKYQWYANTDLFNVLTLTDGVKAYIKEKGPDIIVDVNQIGFESQWARRYATTVTPDF